ncbi:copper ABC transporter permease [Shewanella sp. SNU WT4]|uniref:ABC transporter permease subunit n=1 Tax=Shewanella sp. SNU WT4 TaxID=2590015 RepID=UPI001125D39F|nr:ABC transporter permease subunit [Shewanella sp. SNU WT4]QDF65930.1 copper ABC transporter permease [Shewanella sp. SNU WT4]
MSAIVWTIAAKEFGDNLRNRWLWMMTSVLVLLAFVVSVGGGVLQGAALLPSLGNQLAALVSLSLLLLPLAAILISYDSFVGEQESGTLLLLLTYPLTKWQLILGKLVGHGLVLAAAMLVAFGGCAVFTAIYGTADVSEVVQGFGHFMLSGWLLAIIFVLIGYGVSLSVREKAKALGVLLLVWFVFVLLYDLVILATVVSFADALNRQWINIAILINPADVFRSLNLAATPALAGQGQSGLASLQQLGVTSLSLYGALVTWLLVSLALCYWRFAVKRL